MLLNLNYNNSRYANCNVVFDESLLQLTDDDDFTLNMAPTFNASITFPSWTNHIHINGTNFNYPLNIPSSLKDLSESFRGCRNFNQPITIPNSVTNCNRTFADCSNFNQPIIIPNSVKVTSGMFSSCPNFNQPVTIPNSVTYCDYMFSNSIRFNSPVTLPGRYSYSGYMFSSCSNFNQSVTMPEGFTNASSLFYGATGYNQLGIVPIQVYDCYSMYSGCSNFNQPVTFEGAITINSALRNCLNFNSSVILRGSVRNAVDTFFNCFTFNKPVILPEGIINSYNMLFSARRFNSVVIIPKTAQRIYNMFTNITGALFNVDNGYFGPVEPDSVLQQPIYIAANNILSRGATNLFGNGVGSGSTSSNINLYITGIQNNLQFSSSFRNNGARILNIFTDDAGQNLLYNTYLLTNGGKPTWTTDADNGIIYNTSMNIYIYNNWNGNIPTGDGYHLLRYYSSNGQELYYNEYIETGYNGGFRFGSCKWSNVPNGAPVTGILENIQEDKNLYYVEVPLPYARQIYGVTIQEVIPNISVVLQNSKIFTNSGIILNSEKVAGVSVVDVEKAGTCLANSRLPSLPNGTRWYSGNSRYGTDTTEDIFIIPGIYSKAKFVVTYRDGNASNGGVKFITRYNKQAINLIHNTGINVKVGSNSNVYVDGDTLNGAFADFGIVNLSYGGKNFYGWEIYALAPVTDGINNYEAGERIYNWFGDEWVGLTVWPR